MISFRRHNTNLGLATGRWHWWGIAVQQDKHWRHHRFGHVMRIRYSESVKPAAVSAAGFFVTVVRRKQ